MEVQKCEKQGTINNVVSFCKFRIDLRIVLNIATPVLK